jgi:hypothetical protein
MASTTAYPMGFPKKEFGWKGQIFYQVTATIQRNSNNAKTLSSHQLMKPLPLTIIEEKYTILAVNFFLKIVIAVYL